MIKQLGEQDAGFLYLETPETPQHVGGVSLVALPPDLPGGDDGDAAGRFFAAYKRHIASRMHLIPLMTARLVQLPFDVDHPFWTEDEAVDLDYHIRRQTLPRPGRISQLEELVGRLHSNFLDRSRPLWEFYVIDGLESGQIAIYTKIHHAAMDGAASQNLIAAMYDPTPQPREITPPPPDPHRHHRLGIEELLRGVADHFVRQEILTLQALPDALKVWSRLVLPDARTLKYDKAVLPPLRTPHTLFNVPITSQRSYALRTLSLSRCKRLARQADAKLNDVVLTLCAGALRAYLQERDACPKAALTAMVPVSLHTPGDTEASNQNAAVLCSLATDVADPAARLLAVREAMVDQKRLLSNIRNVLLPDLGFVGSGALMRGLVDLWRRAKLADKLPPGFNLVISNVPGPPVPLFVAGARVLSFHPCSIPFHGSALNITVHSYCDSLDFGLVACRRTVPDLAELADALEPALAELEQAVAGALAPPPARPARPARRTATAETPASAVVKAAAKPAAKADAKTGAKPAAGTAAKTVATRKPRARRAAAAPDPVTPNT